MIPLNDENPTRHFPWVTMLLLAANILVFVYQVLLEEAGELFLESCALVPAELLTGQDAGVPACVSPLYLTLFTSIFLHAGLLHVGSNMLYLWIFGNNVEDSMGPVKFTLFYALCGLAAAATQIAVTLLFDPASLEVPNVGASGAIAGVLGAYLVLFPGARVRTLVIFGFFWSITRVPALLVLGLWFVLQFLQGIGVLGDLDTGGVAVWAHVGGFVAGLVLIRFFATKPRGRRLQQVWYF